jgi:protein-L-isoaspartate(D-aspartate) O-methyltransferase
MEAQAYLDRPLHVGFGQTISQPLIVAMMTEALFLTGEEKILEIGTGSGYQAAILAELCKELYTIERIRDLSVRARVALYKLGYKNIKLKIGDGTLGWPENAPYDRIIVTAGAPCVPDALKQQLFDGGRLLIPVGGEDIQSLELITRTGDSFETKKLTGCRFVKLIGKEGWRKGD